MIMTLEERAKHIAEEANGCCYRSDGWEEHIYKLTLVQLQEAFEEGKQTTDRKEL